MHEDQLSLVSIGVSPSLPPFKRVQKNRAKHERIKIYTHLLDWRSILTTFDAVQ
jgi:hypothetical protein